MQKVVGSNPISRSSKQAPFMRGSLAGAGPMWGATGRRRMKQVAIRVGLATAIVLGLLGVTGAVSGAFAGSAAVPPPSADPFYKPPANLASHRPGTILRRRRVT